MTDEATRTLATTSILESLGGVAVQMALSIAGMPGLVTVIGGVQGASEQIRIADANPNASQIDKAVTLITSIIYALPDYFIFKGMSPNAAKATKALWTDQMINAVYRKAVSMVGEKAGLEITRKVLAKDAGGTVTNVKRGLGEGGQESLEKTGNDVTARVL